MGTRLRHSSRIDRVSDQERMERRSGHHDAYGRVAMTEINENSHKSPGHTALACAVIQQAIDDAIGNAKGKSPRLGKERALAQREARDWFLKPNRRFAEVCDLAGLEPDRVRASAMKVIAKADLKAIVEGVEAPGEGQDFPDAVGTGGERHARDGAELDFFNPAEGTPCP
jgi:hypothetical protein